MQLTSQTPIPCLELFIVAVSRVRVSWGKKGTGNVRYVRLHTQYTPSQCTPQNSLPRHCCCVLMIQAPDTATKVTELAIE